MSVNRKDGTDAAKALAQVAQTYIESGTTAATVATAMVAEGAAMIARMTNAKGAAKVLRGFADTLERDGPIKAKPKSAASRPATADETMAMARSAVEAMANEFAALAFECAALIKSGKSAAARKRLMAAANKLAKAPPKSKRVGRINRRGEKE